MSESFAPIVFLAPDTELYPLLTTIHPYADGGIVAWLAAVHVRSTGRTVSCQQASRRHWSLCHNRKWPHSQVSLLHERATGRVLRGWRACYE